MDQNDRGRYRLFDFVFFEADSCFCGDFFGVRQLAAALNSKLFKFIIFYKGGSKLPHSKDIPFYDI
jgi:hypothetical protein